MQPSKFPLSWRYVTRPRDFTSATLYKNKSNKLSIEEKLVFKTSKSFMIN